MLTWSSILANSYTSRRAQLAKAMPTAGPGLSLSLAQSGPERIFLSFPHWLIQRCTRHTLHSRLDSGGCSIESVRWSPLRGVYQKNSPSGGVVPPAPRAKGKESIEGEP